ncbi:diaminopimelate epimerase [Dyella thiooxydans]|uniref:Diaminopimelate epimerase n=1 Tax=Dyella thiooxydans TaxID=445710 RepID=A0A161JJG6_9GAMM|nr:diaminopimelate epimerase [Dyella thiooxydans]AND70369.1 diaminopimelate epimerase [Dyella thiooxydans]
MTLRFSKMHGIGNDFVVLDRRHDPSVLDVALVRAMADRRKGVGFDQLLTVEPARDPSCAFYYGIWNADGSPSGQCGNGARCVAAWLHRAGALPLGRTVRLESPSGPVAVQLQAPLDVAVDMGEPVFEPSRVPFQRTRDVDGHPLVVGSDTLTIGVASMGNPHAVLLVEDIDAPGVDALGPRITTHPDFPQQVNAGFAQPLARDHIRLRVHERGAGWTLACGTGACAAMAVLRRRGLVDTEVRVDLPGGSLTITWPGPGHTLWMRGPAAFVFEGEWPA